MSSQASNSPEPSSSFNLLEERIQRWIWQAGWTELKDAQERAIPLILKGDDDIIIAAATASGKTEAAFLPILTALLASKTPRFALYISPLKALINDQWDRLDRLCASLEIPVVGWHGDVAASRKKKFFENPSGCLLITPESLEGLLMRQGHALQGPFGGLAYIVVDELHAFIGSERGKQLQSLMHRIETALKRRVVRIGLSATLGEMQLAAEFLRPGAGDKVQIIKSDDSGQELKVIVKGFYDKPSEDKPDEPSAGALAIGESLYKTLRGSNNLVFPNSRTRVETYSDQLRRFCERDGFPNEFWPHHGSLSKEVREQTEQALKSGERPATAVATNTLELGIDIGSVTSIAQVGPAPSVASLRQRLGRSGRRKGEPAILRSYSLEREITPKTPLPDQLRQGLVQTIAQVRLLVKGWYEPPQVASLHLSTLIQQLLALIAQYGGLSAAQAWGILCESKLFPNLTKAEFAELLRGLGEKEILTQDASGLLLHGPVGERLVNHYSFLAAFASDEEFRIVSGGKTLGTLPLSRPVEKGSYIIFAGRRWQVMECSLSEKLIQVIPAKGGKPPIFDGMGGKAHDHVREEMRSILLESAPISFLDATAATQLGEARKAFSAMDLGRQRILPAGADVYVFTWKGDRVNDTLALLLSRQNLRAVNEGVCFVVIGVQEVDVRTGLSNIASVPPPSPEQLAESVQNKRREKWDWLLPENLLSRGFSAAEFEIPGAVALSEELIG